MNPYVSLIIGVVCAGVGGELFVRGLAGLYSAFVIAVLLG